ncbi:hypothetical protein FOZ63_027886 [Perkinsus olseni]|uniref:Glutamine amidotransferase type-2 domain-containing protein n=1 Tax=Perkinsus olseni TaxID=32597 RepID=A0A7J6UQ56_PEROL|nr:hypothetical protein FOZ63_027886 [Perkinsus olseni]
MGGRPFFSSSDDEDMVALFNGEIYNWEELAEGHDSIISDGQVILPLYRDLGIDEFVRHLDGEFAILVHDRTRSEIALAVDTFSTKPLWFAREGSRFAAATYKSALYALGFIDASSRMVSPNRVLVFVEDDSGNVDLSRTITVTEFDIRQYKKSTADFETAFIDALRKRTHAVRHPIFIGLSSGHDSGAIHLGLLRLGLHHTAVTISGDEDLTVVENRVNQGSDLNEHWLLAISGRDDGDEANWVETEVEHFNYTHEADLPPSLSTDQASRGLSLICRHMRDQGALVYLSGTGGDEVLSDYAFNGTRFGAQSQFGGLWPRDLHSVFPWGTLFLSTQRDYLMKEELVAGSHGVEGRYPFLDRRVVQEWLWLSADVKNSAYKAPLKVLFDTLKYPYLPTKVGFSVMSRQLPSDEPTHIWKSHLHAPRFCPPPLPTDLISQGVHYVRGS